MDDVTRDSLTPEFLARYLAGGSSERERWHVEQWLSEDQKHRETLASLQVTLAEAARLVEPERTPATKYTADQVGWAQLMAEVGISSGRPPMGTPRRTVRGTVGIVASAAAILGLVVATVIAIVIGVHKRSFKASEHEYVAAAGQRLQVTLTDGTRVILGPASRLRLAHGYGLGNRETTLEGEGYFVVVHDAVRPFTVEARGIVTRDVGTAFDVRAYPNESETQVAVAEGEVVVGRASLMAGDIAQVGVQGVAVRHKQDITTALAWMQGTLVFDKVPLRQAVQDIGRTFAVTVVIADSTLDDKRITATLSDRPLDVVLAVITQSLGATYQRIGGKIVIRRASIGVLHQGDTTAPRLTTASRGLGNT